MTTEFQMNQDLAVKLFEEGSCCLFLGIPHGIEFGIDFKSWTTGEKFLGIKMVPPGFHYIHYSMTNKHGDVAPRAGFIWHTGKKDLLVKKWNESTGLFEDEIPERVERIRENLKNLDQNLGPYPYETWEKWKNLTSEINQPLAVKLTPLTGVISSVLELQGSSNDNRKTVKTCEATPERKRLSSTRFSDVDNYGDMLPSLKSTPEKEIRFSKIPEKSFPPNATPSDITKHSLDSSYLLDVILAQHEEPDDVLGEIQFAYVSFLVGHSMESFEHWKRLVGVLCAVQESMLKYTSLFSNFISVLKTQLDEIPEDFLVDIVASRNFIYQSLRILFQNIIIECKDGRLKSKAVRFQEYLTDKFQWDFSDILEDDEDDLPVIVHM